MSKDDSPKYDPNPVPLREGRVRIDNVANTAWLEDICEACLSSIPEEFLADLEEQWQSGEISTEEAKLAISDYLKKGR